MLRASREHGELNGLGLGHRFEDHGELLTRRGWRSQEKRLNAAELSRKVGSPQDVYTAWGLPNPVYFSLPIRVPGASVNRAEPSPIGGALNNDFGTSTRTNGSVFNSA